MKVSVPVAVGVPLIVRLPVPLEGTVSPVIAPLDFTHGERDRARAPDGGDCLVVRHVDRVRRKRCLAEAQLRGAEHVGGTLAALPPTVASSAPTTTVLPLIETEQPNWSSAAPSDAVSFCVWVRFPTNRTQGSRTRRPRLGQRFRHHAKLAPTTTVLPLIETEEPNASCRHAIGGGELGGLGHVRPIRSRAP